MSRVTRIGLLCGLASVAVQGGGCGAGSAPDPALADVVFAGGADETALGELVAASPAVDATKGVVIDAPATDSILNAATVVTFRWHPQAATARRAPVLLPSVGEAAGPPRWIRDLLGPVRAARADGSMSGAGYFLVFATELKPELLRVFTTDTTYTPDANAWKTLSSAMIWTKLSIVSAAFQDDQMVAGSGPFEGSPILFCIDKTPGS